MSAIVEESGLEKRLQQIARTARINWPNANISHLEKYKARMKEKATKEWARLKSQGKTLPAIVGDKIGNAWLSNSTIFRPSKFITALKLRANIGGDRAALARAKITKDVNCRKCRAQTETLGHILGQCTYTKKERIERHDAIKDYNLQRIVDNDKTVTVTRETTLGSPEGGVLKPDLVVKNQEGVFVVDVTVRHEDNDYLQMGRQSKLNKYTPLLPELQKRLASTRAEVLQIIIGTRGALPQSERSDLLRISLMAFRKLIDIYNNFMDYKRPPRSRKCPARHCPWQRRRGCDHYALNFISHDYDHQTCFRTAARGSSRPLIIGPRAGHTFGSLLVLHTMFFPHRVRRGSLLYLLFHHRSPTFLPLGCHYTL
jgi:hypothetical protein